MVCDSNIIYQVSTLLVCSAGTVHPCDSLQKIVVRQLLIQVHDLLNRSVKSRQQHRSNDKNAVIAVAAFETCLSERSLKAVNDHLILALVRVLFQMCILVRSAGRDDAGGLELLQLFDVDVIRIVALKFLYLLGEECVNRFLITVCRLLADAYNLCFKSVSENRINIVVDHIGRFFVYNFLRLKVSSDRILAEDFKLLLVIKIAEDIDEGVVHCVVIGNLAVCCTAFVFDFYDNAVFLRLAHRVGIDVTAEVIDRLGNRSPRKCDLYRVRHTFPHIRSQFRVFGTVRLIDHNQNAIACIENRECGN